jgi:hypothetical protein
MADPFVARFVAALPFAAGALGLADAAFGLAEVALEADAAFDDAAFAVAAVAFGLAVVGFEADALGAPALGAAFVAAGFVVLSAFGVVSALVRVVVLVATWVNSSSGRPRWPTD